MAVKPGVPGGGECTARLQGHPPAACCCFCASSQSSEKKGNEQAPASSLISWPKTSCFALGFLSQKQHVSTAGQSKIVVASGLGEAPKMRNRVGSVEKCKQVGR